MVNAKATTQFCPMLAILFVGTRLRALMITNNTGAPQGWVPDGMYLATWAVLIQFHWYVAWAFSRVGRSGARLFEALAHAALMAVGSFNG